MLRSRKQNRRQAARRAKSRTRQFESLEARQLLAGDTASPTVAQAVAGDANLDGAFDQSDLVLVFQAGKYETGQRASWAQGDWDRDGFFSTADLVDALKEGCYGLPGPGQQVDSSFTVLKPQQVFDPAFGQVAGTVFIPDGWISNVGVDYGPIPAFIPSSFLFAATPDRTMGYEGYASEANLTWTEGPFGPAPVGSVDQTGLVFSPPLNGAAYFRQNILPNLRQQNPDYEILSIQQEPGLINVQAERQQFLGEQIAGIGGQLGFDAISVRARYRVGGQLIEETVYCTLQYTSFVNGPFATTNWGLTSMERTFAPAGTLEQNLPLLRSVGRTLVVNRSWFIAVRNHRAALAGIQANAQQAYNGYIASQNQLASERDQIHEQFVQYIRGTEIATNPFTGDNVEVASGGGTWFSQGGDILVGADAGFNPTTQLGGVWQRG